MAAAFNGWLSNRSSPCVIALTEALQTDSHAVPTDNISLVALKHSRCSQAVTAAQLIGHAHAPAGLEHAAAACCHISSAY